MASTVLSTVGCAHYKRQTLCPVFISHVCTSVLDTQMLVCVFILFNFLLNQHSVIVVTHFGAVLGEKAETVAYMTQPSSCFLQSFIYLTSHPHSDHTALAAPLRPEDGND